MDINYFNNSFSNEELNVKKYFLLVLFFIVLLFFILKNNSFYDYYLGSGVVSNNMIKTSVLLNNLEKINTNNKIEIGGSTFTYEVESIEKEDYIYGENYYKMVNIKIIESFNYIENDYINYKIILDKDTMFSYFLKQLQQRGS